VPHLLQRRRFFKEGPGFQPTSFRLALYVTYRLSGSMWLRSFPPLLSVMTSSLLVGIQRLITLTGCDLWTRGTGSTFFDASRPCRFFLFLSSLDFSLGWRLGPSFFVFVFAITTLNVLAPYAEPMNYCERLGVVFPFLTFFFFFFWSLTCPVFL